jgi:hypothetical protein
MFRVGTTSVRGVSRSSSGMPEARTAVPDVDFMVGINTRARVLHK